MFLRVSSLALGQDCPSASEVTLEDMGKTDQTQQNMNPVPDPRDVHYCGPYTRIAPVPVK